jgi:hypothetical protein
MMSEQCLPSPTAAEVVSRLDEEAFPAFSELLAVSQAYASFSGCRFHMHTFAGLLDDCASEDACDVIASNACVEPVRVIAAERAADSGPLLAAKLQAVPVMRRFVQRLRTGDVTLAEELLRAAHIVTAECLHNSMCATFKELDMWPPSPPPPGVMDDDCAYLDLSAPFPVVAQRAYNEKVKRLFDVVGAMERSKRLAETASFLLDFSQDTSGVVAKTPWEEQQLLARFTELANEYRAQCDGATEKASPIQGIREGIDSFCRGGKEWWGENRDTVAWTTVGAVAVAAAVGSASRRRGR